MTVKAIDIQVRNYAEFYLNELLYTSENLDGYNSRAVYHVSREYKSLLNRDPFHS